MDCDLLPCGDGAEAVSMRSEDLRGLLAETKERMDPSNPWYRLVAMAAERSRNDHAAEFRHASELFSEMATHVEPQSIDVDPLGLVPGKTRAVLGWNFDATKGHGGIYYVENEIRPPDDYANFGTLRFSMPTRRSHLTRVIYMHPKHVEALHPHLPKLIELVMEKAK